MRRALRKEGDVEENFIKGYNDLDKGDSLQQMMKSLKQEVPNKPISPPEPPPNTPELGPDQLSGAELEDIDNLMMGKHHAMTYKFNALDLPAFGKTFKTRPWEEVKVPPQRPRLPPRSACLTCMAVATINDEEEG